jgi:hypothetical protein
MAVDVVVGAVLVAGMVLFLVGAGGWRPAAYDVPLAQALPAIHRDRRRWRWIHVWMTIAMLVTPAGLAGMAVVVTEPAARVAVVMAAVVYGIGAVCWIASLTFRVTVVPWAAEEADRSGVIPEAVPAFDRWATSLYAVHMCSAYLASSTLGLGLVAAGTSPRWLGWAGVVWGLVFLAGFATPRVTAFFRPPFWAHLFTGAVGVSLLIS